MLRYPTGPHQSKGFCRPLAATAERNTPTAQRKTKSRAPVTPSPRHAVTPSNIPGGAEILRRALLALVTALIVARPLVLGEDPGLLSSLSEPSGMVLTLLWLVAAAGWAVWRAWSAQGPWYGGAVEIALFAVVVLMFISAGAAASYKHPAWLIAWEWLALWLAFCLVRQLAAAPAEQHGLLAVVLASAVSLSAYGVYHHHVTMREQREEYLSGQNAFEALRPEFVAVAGAAPAAAFPANFNWTALVLSSQETPLLPVPPLEPLRQKLARRGVVLDPDDPSLENWARRIEMNHAYSRFAHPNSFAGYLALLVPAAAGCALVSWRSQRPAWQTNLTVGCAVLMAYALWLTHSRGAILGLLVAGGAGAAWYWRRFLREHKRWAAAGLAALLVVAAAGYLMLRGGGESTTFGKGPSTVQVRLDYWSATWKMIGRHPWLGVGPGNFSRFYPRHMDESAVEHITDPHNFVLEVWATAGVFAVIALLVALGVFFWQIWKVTARRAGGVSPPLAPPQRGADAPRSPTEAPRSPTEDAPHLTPDRPLYWEFYVGGMAGLLLGFLLNLGGKSPDEILVEGFTSAVLSVVWFASFALLEGLDWSGPGRVVTLAAGVAALLLNLCVSGGIGFPSVALPLWVMAALTLNALGWPPLAWLGRHWLARILPLPALAALAFVYYSSFFDPVIEGARLSRTALEHGQRLAEVQAFAREKGAPKLTDLYLTREVLDPLKKATQADPRNARLHLQQAHWYGELWRLEPRTPEVSKVAVLHAEAVHGSIGRRDMNPGIDPEGKDGYLTDYQLRMMFADGVNPRGKEPSLQFTYATSHREQYEIAARMLHEVVKRDPTETRLRYQLAEVLFLADQATAEFIRLAPSGRAEALKTASDPKLPEKTRLLAEVQAKWIDQEVERAAAERAKVQQEARRQAQRALDLDKKAKAETRRLTDRQREQVRRWLEPASPP